MTPRRVGITGLGVVTGYGVGTETLWRGLLSGRSAVRRHKAYMGRAQWLEYPMAASTSDMAALETALPKRHVIASGGLHRDRDLMALAECVRQAIQDAGLEYDHDRNDVGLVVTHESPGLAAHVQSFFQFGRTFRAWLRSSNRFSPPRFLYDQQRVSVYQMHSFLYIQHLSSLFDLHGFTLYNNNACSSGVFSMAVAAERIRSGQSDVVIVAGGDLPEDGTKYKWFDEHGLYSRSGECRPFSRRRDGLVLGSGAAAVVMESFESAGRRGRPVLAEWRGAGFSSDGWKVMLPDVVGLRYTDAIRRALEASAVEPSRVTAICPHGVGGGVYDRYEATCLSAVFGNGAGRWPPMMAWKGALGHTLGGCVLVEMVASLLAMRHHSIPEQAVCRDVDPTLPMGEWNDAPVGRGWVLLKCANGFAGQNGAMVLADPPGPGDAGPPSAPGGAAPRAGS